MTGLGKLSTLIIDPVLIPLARLVAPLEVPVNVALIVVFLGVGIGLALVKQEKLRPWLVASLVLSILMWWLAQAFGMILTGLATDFNSGLLLALMTLACWPKSKRALEREAQIQSIPQMEQSSGSERLAGPAVS